MSLLRRLLFAAALVVGLAGDARALDTVWQADANANGHRLFGLAAPTLGTGVLRLQDATPGNCILQATAVNGSIICSTLTGFTASPPLLLTGSTLSLPLDGSLGTAGGNLQRSALTGAVTAGAGSNVTAFGNGTALSVLGVAGASTAPNAQIVATTDSTALQRVGGTLAWQAIGPQATTGIVSNWPIANFRWYCVSDSSGSDLNAGYSDTSSSDCATKAKQTIGALNSIFPSGAGHKVIVEIDPRPSNVAYADAPAFLAQVSGYSAFGLFGTGTNSTAGSIAFNGDINDAIYAGAMTAPGMFAAGYTVVGTPTTTTIQLTKTGGGSPSFPSEPALPLGARFRYDISTPTVLLRNVARTISAVAGTDTVSVDTVFPAAPAVGDFGYIETPGVLMPGLNFSAPDPALFVHVISGIQFTSSLAMNGAAFKMAFIGGTSVRCEMCKIFLSTNYPYPVGAVGFPLPGGSRISGGGFFTSGNATIDGTIFLGTVNASSVSFMDAQAGDVFAAGLVLDAVGNAPTIGSATGMIGSRAGNGRAVRITGAATTSSGLTGGLIVRGSRITTGAIDITGMGSNPAVLIEGTADISIAADSTLNAGLTGSTGNTDIGLDLTNSYGSRIVSAALAPTVTGTAGDVRMPGGAIESWAQLRSGNIDQLGNTAIGIGIFPFRILPAGVTFDVLAGTGTRFVTADSTGLLGNSAVAGFLADPGSNGIVVRTAAGTTTAGQLSGPITTTGTSLATALNLGAGGISGTLPLANLGAPTGSGFAHVTSGAWDSAARAVDLSTADATGILAAARSPAYTGDATKPSGSLATAFRTFNATSVLGRAGTSSGIPTEISSSANNQVLQQAAGVLVFNTLDYSQLTGTPNAITSLTTDVTATGPGAAAATIASNAVTNGKFRQSGALSVVGRNVNTTGNVADISAIAGSDCVYRESGSTIGCGTVATAGIAASAVTYAKIQNETAQTLLGNSNASTAAAPAEITIGSGLTLASGVLSASGGAGTVTSVSGTSGRISSTGGTTPVIDLVNTAVTPSSYTYASLTVDAAGRLTAASSGATPAPVGATYVTQTPDATLTSEQALSALATGILKNTTTTGVLTIAAAGTDYESPLTFSTGLTRATNTITSNLSVGVSGGQSVIGGTASGDNLTVSSTSNSTKGVITFDSVLRAPNASSSAAAYSFTNSTNSGMWWDATNAQIDIKNQGVLMLQMSTSTLFTAGSAVYLGSAAGLGMSFDGSALLLTPGSGRQVAFKASAMATTDTLGYLEVPSAAGPQTGVPSPIETGQVPIVYDSTNNRLQAYKTSWRIIGTDTSGFATGPLCNTTTTGVHSACTIGAGLSLSGTSLDLGVNGTVSTTFAGYVKQILLNPYDQVVGATTVTGAPATTYKWSGSFSFSTTGIFSNTGTVLVPGDNPLTTSDSLSPAPGGTIPQAMQAAWGTASAKTAYVVPRTYASGTWWPDIAYIACTGSGNATVELSLWESSDMTTTGSYTQLASVSTTIAAGVSGFQGFSAQTWSTSVPSGNHVFMAVRRTDSNSGAVVQPINYTGTAEFVQ